MGAVLFGMKPLPRTEERLRCPNCATFMEKISVDKAAGKLVVDHCARCGKMWFDPYELQQAAASKKAVSEIDYGTADHDYDLTMHRPGLMACPRDNTTLTAVPDPRQPHVIIDICASCGGVLLDAGELKDLSEITLTERLKAFFKR